MAQVTPSEQAVDLPPCAFVPCKFGACSFTSDADLHKLVARGFLEDIEGSPAFPEPPRGPPRFPTG